MRKNGVGPYKWALKAAYCILGNKKIEKKKGLSLEVVILIQLFVCLNITIPTIWMLQVYHRYRVSSTAYLPFFVIVITPTWHI